MHRTNGKIIIDGVVDEEAWKSIPPLPLTMHWPSFEGEISERTEIRIAYDDEFIYVGAICFDSEPGMIQTPSFKRDEWNEQEDQVAVAFDTYDDNENTLVFATTPTGSRIDCAIKNDGQGDGVFNLSWDSYWIAESTEHDQGWSTEMRIPFSSLRFQEDGGKVEMGLIAYRYIARKRELNIYPNIPPDWGYWSFAKASQASTIAFENIDNKRPWYVSPYGLAGIGHHYETNNEGVLGKKNDQNLQVGLDVQHAFTDNLNVDFTVNTDFAQVEADNQVVNLSRFSLFFPEKRRFFLERASIFDFKTESNNNLFYSRRIGIDDGGIVPLWGGVRAAARLNKWDVGVLSMQSREIEGIASENFGVMRLRKNVINERSYIGGMMTTRIGVDGRTNVAYGVDGIINLFKQDYLQVNVAQSIDSEDSSDIRLFDRSRMYVAYENRIINGFRYKFTYSSVGNEYRPGLGFEERYNFSRFGDQLSYSWFAKEESSLRQTTITLNGGVSLSNTTFDIETTELGLSSNWAWDRGSSLTLGVNNFTDHLPSAFSLSDSITIEPATYGNNSVSIGYTTSSVGLMMMETNAKVGTFYGGDLISASIAPSVIFSKYFALSTYYEFNTIAFAELDETFISHVARLNLSTSLNVKWSMSGFLQYNSLYDISTFNFRLRYTAKDGQNLYIVYNEVLNNGTTPAGRELPFSDTRAVMVKYIHTFGL